MTKTIRKPTKHAELDRPPDGFRWIWLTDEMINSPAARAIRQLASYRILSRIILEHLAKARLENGNLIVTYSDFQRFGVRRNSIASAIIEMEALGFVDVIRRGFYAYSDLRIPSIYSLSWLYRKDGTPPTNRWKVFKTEAEARKAVRSAMTAAKKSKPKNKKPVTNPPLEPVTKAILEPVTNPILERPKASNESDTGFAQKASNESDTPFLSISLKGDKGTVEPGHSPAGGSARGNGSDPDDLDDLWIRERCVRDSAAASRTAELLPSRRDWAKCNGYSATIIERDFLKALAVKGFANQKTRLGFVIYGLRLGP